MKKIIDIDMDDTLCNYSSARYYAIKKDPLIEYPQSQYGFFYNLQPMDGAIWFVNLLQRDFDVHIVTRPSVKNLLCYTEKAAWVKEHFGEEMLNNLTITCHKDRLDGDYLIDDVEWPAYPGEQILFGKQPFENWRKVWFYIMRKENLFK